MISSSEEFGLLLTKWKNESSKVGVIFKTGDAKAFSLVYLVGSVTVVLAADGLFTFQGADNNFAMINYSKCQIGYVRAEDIPQLKQPVEPMPLLDTGDFLTHASMEECFAIYPNPNTTIFVVSLER